MKQKNLEMLLKSIKLPSMIIILNVYLCPNLGLILGANLGANFNVY